MVSKLGVILSLQLFFVYKLTMHAIASSFSEDMYGKRDAQSIIKISR